MSGQLPQIDNNFFNHGKMSGVSWKMFDCNQGQCPFVRHVQLY